MVDKPLSVVSLSCLALIIAMGTVACGTAHRPVVVVPAKLPVTKSRAAQVRRPEDSSDSRLALIPVVELAQTELARAGERGWEQFPHLNSAMGSVQRTAQRGLDDEGRDPTGLAAKRTTLLGALLEAANSTADIELRPTTPEATRRNLAQLGAQLRNHYALLADAWLPLPEVRSVLVSTPERRAAIAVLDLAQSARADASFVGVQLHTSLAAGLEALERAAQSVLLGADSDGMAARARLDALASLILLTERVAVNIGGRDNESDATRRKAVRLAAALRETLAPLRVAPPTADEQARNAQRWLGWMTPVVAPAPEASTLESAGRKIAGEMARLGGWTPDQESSRLISGWNATWTDGRRKLEFRLYQSDTFEKLRDAQRLFMLRAVMPPHRRLEGVGNDAQLLEMSDRVQVGFTVERDLLHVVMDLQLAGPAREWNSPAPAGEVEVAITLARNIAAALGANR